MLFGRAAKNVWPAWLGRERAPAFTTDEIEMAKLESSTLLLTWGDDVHTCGQPDPPRRHDGRTVAFSVISRKMAIINHLCACLYQISIPHNENGEKIHSGVG